MNGPFAESSNGKCTPDQPLAGFVARSENISGSSPGPGGSTNRPLPGSLLDEEVGAPMEVRVLLERLDPQAGVDERRDDLAEAVVPAVFLLLADVGGRVGVGALDVEDQRVAMLPVRVREPQLAGRHALASKTLKTGWASVM